jgi:hypothetical protein
VPAVEQVVMKALAKDPELRFATVSDFAHALEEALQPPVKHIQPLPEVQRRQRTRSFSVAMTSALIALVVLVVGASTLLSYEAFSSSSRPSFQGAAATATAQASLATADARFVGQNPQDIYTRVTNGKPVINDSLRSQDGSTWKDEHLAPCNCTFTGGAYHVTAVKNQFMNCLSARRNLSNFAFQVEMTIVKGDHDYKHMPSYGGISFRVDSSSAKFYRFILGTDGFYVFSVPNNTPLLRNDPILCKIELSAESQKKSLLLGRLKISGTKPTRTVANLSPNISGRAVPWRWQQQHRACPRVRDRLDLWVRDRAGTRPARVFHLDQIRHA